MVAPGHPGRAPGPERKEGPVARFSLIPRQGRFFENFAALAQRLRDGCVLLERMVETEPPDLVKAS